MDYPSGFPEHLKPPVEQAMAEAEIRYLGARRGYESENRYETYLPELIYAFIKKTFFVFARQARQAGEEGIWSVEQIRTAIDYYLRHLIVDTFFEKHPSPATHERQWFVDQTRSKLLASKEWVQHQRGLASLAKSSSSKERPLSQRKSPASRPSDLADIRRAFVQPRLLEKGMSPSKWADRAGFDTSVIYDYLNGRSKPRPETRKAMAEALGVTAIELPE
jgi:lambda repressor-like predicted transcriptional regulator